MKRALVLGGGGHLGAGLVRALVDRGAAVTASTKGEGPRRNLDGIPHVRVTGDDNRDGTLESWADGHDLIIDAAAPYALDLHDPAQSHTARLQAAQQRMDRLIAIARKSGAILIYVGSILTMQNASTVQHRLIEAAHPYFKMKRTLQAQAIKAARTGQPVVVVNPSSLLGPWNLRPFHHCYVSAVLTGGMPASFPDTINVMDVRDAAETILRTTAAGWYGTPVPISGHDISVHDLTDLIVDLGGVRRPPRWRALAAGAAVLYSAEAAMGTIGLRSPYPSLPVLLTLASGPVRLGAVQQELGPAIRPLDRTITDEITWHRDRGCP